MLVTTLPKKGSEAKVFNIPEADLSKYETVEATMTTYDEGKDRVAEGEQIEGGLQLDKIDVQAYSEICICYYWWRGVLYYKYCYCSCSCP